MTHRDLETKKIGAKVYGELWNVMLEENEEDKRVSESNKWIISWTYMREEDISIYKILCRKANWIGHILRRNCLLHDATEIYITEVKKTRKKNTAPWWFDEQKMILGAKGGS